MCHSFLDNSRLQIGTYRLVGFAKTQTRVFDSWFSLRFLGVLCVSAVSSDPIIVLASEAVLSGTQRFASSIPDLGFLLEDPNLD